MSGPLAVAELLALARLHDRASGAAVLQAGPRRRVTRLAGPAGEVVCKEEPCRGFGARLQRRLLGSRARRALGAARALRAAGIEAPEPLGALEQPARSLLFLGYRPGPTLARALEQCDARRAGALLLLAAELTARLHRAGFAPRDLKPQNLILEGGPGSERLVPVDLDDVTLRAPDRAGALRNLAALDAYTQLAPHPPGVGARLRAFAAATGCAAGTGRAAGSSEPERALLREALRASRAKRATIQARVGA